MVVRGRDPAACRPIDKDVDKSGVIASVGLERM